MPGAHSHILLLNISINSLAWAIWYIYVIQKTIADLSAGHSVVRMHMYGSTLCFQSYS